MAPTKSHYRVAGGGSTERSAAMRNLKNMWSMQGQRDLWRAAELGFLSADIWRHHKPRALCQAYAFLDTHASVQLTTRPLRPRPSRQQITLERFMRLATIPLVVLILTACTGTQQRSGPIADCPPGGVVEVAMSDTASRYVWRGEELGMPQLETSLQDIADRCTVGELRLLQGARTASIADLIPLAMLGDGLGIKVTYEDASGAVKSVQFVQ